MPYSVVDKPSKYFNTLLYAGNSTAGRTVTGAGFSPDFLWLKDRSNGSAPHFLSDSVRGNGKWLRSNTTNSENTDTNVITSLDSDGFTVGTDVYSNNTGDNYVGWCWDANGAGSSNTAGSISSTVSANTTSGFSIVSYTGNGTDGATVGHGLGVTPAMVIYKARGTPSGANGNWLTWHRSISQAIQSSTTIGLTGFTGALYLNLTSSSSTYGFDNQLNQSSLTYVAYCFAEVKGYSKFGSYTGNSSTDGTFVYLGFKPAFVIIKNITNGNNWIMLDNKRGTYNLQSTTLYPNTTDVETSTTTNFGMDFLSNGMKMRTSGGYTTNSNNASGNTYIYMAFAENPFCSSKGIPTTAR